MKKTSSSSGLLSLFLYGWWGASEKAGNFNELKVDRLLLTMTKLQKRIAERFPGSGLSSVSAELCRVGSGIEQLLDRLHRPIWQLRVLTIGAITTIIAVVAGLITVSIQLSPEVTTLADFLQTAESAINELIFLAIAIFFFGGLEQRFKRVTALRSLHGLRSIAHVVDMHQLTKDPAYVLLPTEPTASSPERLMTRQELTRYLDYCSELLALTSKLAALHAQYISDTVVLHAVNEVESLTHGLSGKIWQKIMILDFTAPSPDETAKAGGTELKLTDG